MRFFSQLCNIESTLYYQRPDQAQSKTSRTCSVLRQTHLAALSCSKGGESETLFDNLANYRQRSQLANISSLRRQYRMPIS